MSVTRNLNLIMNILDALTETKMDYEVVAEWFQMSPAEIFEIAKTYGDI